MNKLKKIGLVLGLALILISIPTGIICYNYQLNKFNIKHPQTIYNNKCGTSVEGEFRCNPEYICAFAFPGAFVIGLVVLVLTATLPSKKL